MRNSSSLDWLRFMHTPNDYRVSRYDPKKHWIRKIKKEINLLIYLFFCSSSWT